MALDRDGILAKALAAKAATMTLAASKEMDEARRYALRNMGRAWARQITPFIEGAIMEIRELDDSRERAKR